jgi:hypothetical protein
MGTRATTQETEDLTLYRKACWEVMERAAASIHLSRAARLREFLFYVGDKCLKDGSAEVHEQEIGANVFGRQAHYDTSQDNIVRVNATELRKRIDAYFAAEGINEPLVFQIPRGSYTPMFRPREEEPQPPAAEPTTAEKIPAPPPVVAEPVAAVVPATRYRRLPLVLALTAVVLLAIFSFVQWRQNQYLHKILYPWESQPALAAFWPRFLAPGQQTDIVLADTSFALVEDITKQSFSLSDYLNHNYLQQIAAPNLSADRKADLDLLVSRLNGSLGDFRVVQRIQALDPTSPTLSVQFSREYTADSIKRHNVILIGSQKSNPWVDLFSDQLNFSVEYDPALNQSFIKNRSVHPGEQAVYPVPVNPYGSAGYSIIAYLPNPSHTADALIIAGTDSQATDAAGEFLTSEDSLSGFLNRLHTKPIPHFELLLKTTRLSGTPFNAEVIAYRTLENDSPIAKPK